MIVGSAGQRDSRAFLVAGGVGLLTLCACVLLYWSRDAALIQYLYPGAVFVIAVWLYVNNAALFFGFSWWIWFLTPFVRRVIDYQTGYNSLNPAMLAPFLVTCLAVVTIFRFWGLLTTRRYLPYSMCMLGVLYGYLIGIINVGVAAATFSLLEWLLPLALGFHVLVYWREYPDHRRVVRKVFTWGVLLMGVYGIVQFVALLPWDAYWMSSAEMSSIGRPQPFRVRVFSTLNAPGPFAMVMMVGLLLLLDGSRLLSRVAALPGGIAFLLSLVRSAWGGWMLGLTFFVARLRGRMRTRLIVIVVISAVFMLPVLLLYGPINERVQSRFDTMNNLEEDNSFNARLRLYIREAPIVLLDPVGSGLGSVGKAAKLHAGRPISFDSGLLGIPLSLGWPGSLLYFGGLLLALRRAFRIREEDTDPFAVMTGSIAMIFVVLLLFSRSLQGLTGFIAWSFLALSLSARRYYEEQRPNYEEMAEEYVEEAYEWHA